ASGSVEHASAKGGKKSEQEEEEAAEPSQAKAPPNQNLIIIRTSNSPDPDLFSPLPSWLSEASIPSSSLSTPVPIYTGTTTAAQLHIAIHRRRRRRPHTRTEQRVRDTATQTGLSRGERWYDDMDVHSAPVAARRMWGYLRAVFFMMRKGKRKLLLGAHLLMKRRNK
uniref:Uncharacterized protein n=1 Tax=Aegilops tauschii subsp. strangulata TaxID=200361 RepID=A0A453GFK0_AEGTS